ncbi:MAG: 50S ribosomal protein L15 [Bacteroidetes bacterium]|nr:50S ribosomal protein L15 [Bacteroidota bacterium]
MNLSNLKPAEGSIKNRKRIGRGQGSGRGGTSTKGHKGAQSRTGYSRKIGFEGGQMPLQRRIPKGGFKNINRVEYAAINLDVLQQIAEGAGVNKVDQQFLIDKHLVNKRELVKVLGRGEITIALEVHAHKFSATAKAAIEKAGGSATEIA